jgi:hypothetical protein
MKKSAAMSVNKGEDVVKSEETLRLGAPRLGSFRYDVFKKGY